MALYNNSNLALIVTTFVFLLGIFYFVFCCVFSPNFWLDCGIASLNLLLILRSLPMIYEFCYNEYIEVKGLEIQELESVDDIVQKSKLRPITFRTTSERFSSVLSDFKLDFEQFYFWFQADVRLLPVATDKSDASLPSKWKFDTPAFSLDVEDLFRYCDKREKLYAIARNKYDTMRLAEEDKDKEQDADTDGDVKDSTMKGWNSFDQAFERINELLKQVYQIIHQTYYPQPAIAHPAANPDCSSQMGKPTAVHA